MPQIGPRIRRIRKDANLSQLEFAKKLSRTQGHISKLETNEAYPSGDLLVLICLKFGINSRWLIEGEGPMKAELGGKNVIDLEKSGLISSNIKEFLILFGEMLVKAEHYDKIVDCLGPDVFELEHPNIKPGDLTVIEIVENALIKLQFKALRKPDGAKLLSSMFPEDLTEAEKSVISLLRCIDNNSLKDFYLFLASKANRLGKKQKEELKKDIAILKKASK